MEKNSLKVKSHMSGIASFVGVTLIFSVVFYLYELPFEAVFYPLLLSLVYLLFIFCISLTKRKSKHEKLQQLIRQPIPVVKEKLPEPESLQENDYQEMVRRIIDKLGEEIQKYETKAYDMNDYYSTWVHQIKTPIASMKLTLQAIDSKDSRKLMRDLKSIEDYVDMVMSYLRLQSEHTDYIIEEQPIKKIVKDCARKCSTDFIEKKLSLSLNMEDDMVLTDKKWITLVIDQLLSNCLKYTKEGGITIAFDKDSHTLKISDTGIGIDKTNLPRIFERGYTGFNGRGEAHSSGIGLYICKSVCDNLHIDIKCESEPGVGTSMFLTFPVKKFFGD